MAALTAFGERVEDLRERRGLSKDGLSRVSGIPHTTLWRKLTGRSPLTLDDIDRIAAALGVDRGTLVGEVQIATMPTVEYSRESEDGTHGGTADEPRPPRRFTAGLPYEVRTWLQAELLDYMRARVPEEELDAAEKLYRSPEVFSFYAGGEPRARTEEDVLKTMRAIAIVVRTELRRRGYQLDHDTPH